MARTAFILILSLLSISAFAESEIRHTPGGIIDTDDNDSIVYHTVNLAIPVTNLRDKFTLTIGSDEFESLGSRVVNDHGREVLEIVFQLPDPIPEDRLAFFTGTYKRQNNLLIYYGDIYLISYKDLNKDGMRFVDRLKKKDRRTLQGFSRNYRNREFFGGFYFSGSP